MKTNLVDARATKLIPYTTFQRYRRKYHRKLTPFIALSFVLILGMYLVVASIYYRYHYDEEFMQRYQWMRQWNDPNFRKSEADEIRRLLSNTDTDGERSTTAARLDKPALEASLARLLRIRRLLTIDSMSDREDRHKLGCIHSSPEENSSLSSVFPDDLFTLQQKRHGFVIFHICGLIYMFIALAIVCDDYFVPSLSVLTEKLSISDDVAGATFMAAGGSAPEFFTSLFGVFITQNNVGIGTIVGSATFNILCVLAFCALCSRDILHLTWWPLFRDMFFYIFALLFLVIIFFDEVIEWFEASTMIIIYIIYGIFMKYNGKIEGFVRFKLNMVTSGHKTSPSERTKSPVNANRLPITGERRRSIPVLHSGGLFRESITKLVREQKSNPFFRDNVPCSTASLRRQATLPLTKSPKNNCSQKRLSLQTSNEIKANNTLRGIEQSVRTKSFDASKRKPTISVIHECAIDGLTDRNSSSVICSEMPGAMLETVESTSSKSVSELSSNTKVSKAGVRFDDKSTDELKCRQKILCPDPEPIDGERPVDLSWPSTTMARLTYVILAPVTYTLYCTLPDTKKAERRKLFILTFLGSILWIAFYAYIMVWWAAVIGETLGIPTEIMGLTLLAAGTSIPDLITSVIVARKGLGDMAVSSSIGSNLFDICIGLPVPWVLHALIFWTFHTSDASSSVAVSSKGLICSVGMLFIMLVILVISIAACRWQMDKKFGAIMLFAYIAFCLLSILLENGILLCPLKTNNYSCR